MLKLKMRYNLFRILTIFVNDEIKQSGFVDIEYK